MVMGDVVLAFLLGVFASPTCANFLEWSSDFAESIVERAKDGAGHLHK